MTRAAQIAWWAERIDAARTCIGDAQARRRFGISLRSRCRYTVLGE